MASAPVAPIRQDEVLTGEAVALDVQPTGFFLRALGALIDVLLSLALALLLILVGLWMSRQGMLDPSVYQMALIVMIVMIAVVLPTVVETATRGRSLGKLAIGGRIVRVDGGAIGFRHAFIRALAGVLEIWLTLGAVAALSGAFTPRSQRVGDLLAGTYCERTRTPRLPETAPGVPPALAEWAGAADVGRLPERLARRAAQFARNAPNMAPAARARVAASLAAEVSAYVSPVPAVDPETLLVAVGAVRRERELRGLELQSARVAALASASGIPRDFPDR